MRAIGVAVVVLLLSTACGGSDGTDQVVQPGPTATAAAEACTDRTDEGGAQALLTMRDNAFEPTCLRVLADQGLQLVNEGQNLHNLTIENTMVDIDTQPGAENNTEALAGVLEPGRTYPFFCKYHRAGGMTGELQIPGA